MDLPGYHFSECFLVLPDAALYHLRQGDFKSAQGYLNYAVKRYPKLAYPYFIYGVYHEELGETDKAKFYFQKAADTAPFFKDPENA